MMKGKSVWITLMALLALLLAFTGDASAQGPTPGGRRVRFLATADLHYGRYEEMTKPACNSSGHKRSVCCKTDMTPGTDAKLKAMIGRMNNNADIRGILIAGDIIDGWELCQKPAEQWQHYQSIRGGHLFFFYDGWGNHDMYADDRDRMMIWDDIANHGRESPINRGQYHYSWDWDDVHLVQLNICIANDNTNPCLDLPKDSLAWLKEDLASHVGSSGRPIVLVYHQPLTTWATSAQQAFTTDILPNYNIIAAFVGHMHPAPERSFVYDHTVWREYIVGDLFGDPVIGSPHPGRGSFVDVTIQLDTCKVEVQRKEVDSTGTIRHKQQKTHTFTIPYVAPTTHAHLAGTLGENGWYTSPVTITLTADHPCGKGVAETRYRIDHGLWQTYTGPFPVHGDYKHTLKYKSKDNAGNWESEKQVSIPIDTTPPTCSFTLNNGADTAYSALVQVNPSASDATSGVYQMRLGDRGGTWDRWRYLNPQPYWQLPDPVTGRRYYVWAQFKDHAGNTSKCWKSITLNIYPARPSSDNYRLVKSTWGTSGTVVSSTHFIRYDTLGQPSLIGRLTSANYALATGYWASTNSPPVLTVDQATVTVNEGDTAANSGIWSDPNGDEVTLTASADTIVKGDGTWSWSLDTTDGPDESQRVQITAQDYLGGTDQVEFALTVNNVAPTLTLAGAAEVNEGSSYTLNLSSSDPGDDTITGWEINWADGTVEPLSGNPSAASHTYTDGPNSYTISVTATDEDGTFNANTLSVTVNNVAPTVGLPTVTPSPSEEGSAVTASATFSDPGSDEAPFDCTLNYDDGSGDQAGIVSGNTCSGDHVYADNGTYSVTVSVTDKDGGTGTGPAASHVVNNVAPEITATGDTIEENGVATVGGTITDPGTQDTFTVVINWGEGTPETFTYPAGTTSYSEQHQYLDDNPTGTPSDVYPVSVTVTDDDGGSDSASTTVTVNNVAPEITATGDTIEENGVATVSGSITDPGTQDTFTVVINWGEGTPETFTYPAGTTSYSEQHQYLDDNPTGTPSDVYPISVNVTDDDGGEGAASASIEVNNVAPSVGPINAPTEPVVVGTAVTAGAPFRDPGRMDRHTAIWDWGDGASTPGALTQGAGSGSVRDRHTYERSGRFTIRLTVTDDDGGKGSARHTLIVQSPSQAIESVGDEVEHLDLPQGLENELTSKLNNALRDLERGQDQGAVNKLNAFINSVKAQRGKKISAAEADGLIQTAQEIIDAIRAGLL